MITFQGHNALLPHLLQLQQQSEKDSNSFKFSHLNSIN